MGFKENLKMLRKAKEITQEELGKAINKSKLTIIRYENGQTFPNLEVLKDISKFFDIELTHLLMDTRYMDKKYTLKEIKEKLRYRKVHTETDETIYPDGILIKNLIYSLSAMITDDFLIKYKDIQLNNKVKILEEVEKYYLFLMSDYKNKK